MSGGGSVRRKGWISGLVHSEFTCQSAEVCVTYTQPQTVEFITETYKSVMLGGSNCGTLIVKAN